MTPWPTLVWLYLANAAVLITHEIDSAFWHEWELLHLPGGIQGFLLLNLLLVLIILYGLRAVILQTPGSLALAWLLTAGGLIAAALHGFFLWIGDPSFRNPTSIGLLALTFALSLTMAVVLLRRTH
jgi:hypothetical protein